MSKKRKWEPLFKCSGCKFISRLRNFSLGLKYRHFPSVIDLILSCHKCGTEVDIIKDNVGTKVKIAFYNEEIGMRWE